MKILDLPLKKEWYAMIESGVKKDEYRELKPYWFKRLSLYDNRDQLIGLNPLGYTHVRFRYGYTKRTMLFEIMKIVIGRGNPKWGAPTDKDVFIIRLGERAEEKHVYALSLSKRQAELLSYACDQFARCIQGQDWTFQELMESAWEKRCKEATGESMDDNWDGGWWPMRKEAEEISHRIKKRFWGLGVNAMYGIHYDDTADILWDIHQVIRHQLWLDRPDNDKSHITVDADEPMRVGDEPLAKIERIE